MKRRWSILFYCALASLIGVSWVARSLGISLVSFVSLSLVGMIAATITAFLALVRDIRDKWPAAIVLVCASPMILDSLQWVRDLPTMVSYFGPSIAVMLLGAIATAAASIIILAARPSAGRSRPRGRLTRK